MKSLTLDESIVEALKFVRRARAYRAARKAEDDAGQAAKRPKESGALKRASMELTRKLADLRQGR